MSATNRGAERVARDAYETPSWCVHRLLERLELPGGLWLEPCAGSGAIIEAVADMRSDVKWNAIEVREECRRPLSWVQLSGLLEGPPVIRDYLSMSVARSSYKVIFTNPPFSSAVAFLTKALEEAEHVVFLLRLNFLASQERWQLFQDAVPDVYVLPNRPSFDGEGTDATEYAWFHWGVHRYRRSGRISVLNPTPKIIRLPEVVL